MKYPTKRRSDAYYKELSRIGVLARHVPLERRFWSKVEKGGPDECWPWKSTIDRHGYGLFWLGMTRKATRVLWELLHGSVPKELCVLHRCDSRNCMNPAHLFLGTNVENIADMDRKGRRVVTRGEDHVFHRLTESKVRSLRAEYAVEDLTQKQIGERYGISQTVAGGIIRGEKWAHVK